MNDKFKVVILANERKEDHDLWIKACENHQDKIEYRIADLTSQTWLEEIQKEPFDYLLSKPGGLTMPYKNLYDERLSILSTILNYKIYPTLEEVLIYENKRYLSYWLKANQLPHPQTVVIYKKDDARIYVNNAVYPIVAKLNIGASGNGIRIINSREEALSYIDQIFGSGVKARTGPRFDKGNLFKRAVDKILNPKSLLERLFVYRSVANDLQKDFCILQEYIPHEYEWRVVRIGNSFFAHKKLPVGGKASGTLKKKYENPPLKLLTFVKKITDKHNFHSQAIDIFETTRGEYLINEMQCIFGQSAPYQMLVDGKPGRYVMVEGSWRFEEGLFNTNQCYDLRLDYILSVLPK